MNVQSHFVPSLPREYQKSNHSYKSVNFDKFPTSAGIGPPSCTSKRCLWGRGEKKQKQLILSILNPGVKSYCGTIRTTALTLASFRSLEVKIRIIVLCEEACKRNQISKQGGKEGRIEFAQACQLCQVCDLKRDCPG